MDNENTPSGDEPPDSRRWKVLADGQKQVLELAARGAPVHEALDALVHAAQSLTEEGAKAAVFFADPDAACLRLAASAGLPDAYTKAVDGFRIGPDQPSCGKAAHTGKEVIVRDAGQDPLWRPYLALARAHGLRACWSFPLHASGGKLLGIFAVYHASPREPEPAVYEEIRHLANIAALLIERHLLAEQAMRERERVEESLREANLNRGLFLAMLAHELRNPLAALHNGIAVLRLARDQGKPLARSLAIMDRQLAQMDRLIEDLVDLNRVTQGKVELRIEEVELQSAIHAALDAVTPHCGKKDQTLDVELPVEPIVLQADPARVTQMMSNLLSNACKFTPVGGNIRLSAGYTGDDVVVQVRDNGIGIAPEDKERIFEMFAQVDNTPRAQRGLGIGLALVKSLAALHGGQIEVHSEGLGKGSEFTLRLPRHARANESTRAP